MNKILKSITIETIYVVLSGMLSVKFIISFIMVMFSKEIFPIVSQLGLKETKELYTFFQLGLGFVSVQTLMSHISNKITHYDSLTFMNDSIFRQLFTFILDSSKVKILSISVIKHTDIQENQLQFLIQHLSQEQKIVISLSSINYDFSLNSITFNNLVLLKSILNQKILELNPAKHILKTFDDIKN